MKWLWIAVIGCGLLACLAVAQDNAAPKKADAKAPAKTDDKKADAKKADDKKADEKKGDGKDKPKPDQPTPPAPKPVEKVKEKVSYGIGLNLGAVLKKGDVELADLDPAILAQGIVDYLTEKKDRQFKVDQIAEAMHEYNTKLVARQVERRKAEQEKQRKLAETNKKEGEAFLAENKKKQGVVTTASGLQYQVIKAGDGPMPKPGDTVSAHYRGTLLDGTVFDESYTGNTPLRFTVGRGGVIAGWDEAVQLMKVGAKWRLFVPSDLAYGANGSGEKIGPNAVLIFEIELLGIE